MFFDESVIKPDIDIVISSPRNNGRSKSARHLLCFINMLFCIRQFFEIGSDKFPMSAKIRNGRERPVNAEHLVKITDEYMRIRIFIPVPSRVQMLPEGFEPSRIQMMQRYLKPMCLPDSTMGAHISI